MPIRITESEAKKLSARLQKKKRKRTTSTAQRPKATKPQKDSANTLALWLAQKKQVLFAKDWQKSGYPSGMIVREYQFDNRENPRKWRFDFAVPEHRLAIEVDGIAYRTQGGGRHMTQADFDKLNQAAIQGWCVLRYTSKTVEQHPLQVVDEIMGIIERKEKNFG
jgi:very-short-patch-repair endonuclease